MLKLVVATLDDVPEALRDQYTKKDGSFVLNIEGIEEHPDFKAQKEKVREFRDNNNSLLKTRDELKASLDAFKDIDPSKHAEAMKALEILDAHEEGRLLKEGKFDEVIDRRTKAMRDDAERRIALAAKEAETWKGKFQQVNTEFTGGLRDAQIRKAVTTIATPVKGAMDDILNRARGIWNLDEERNLVAMEGDKPAYGSKGEALTLEEWTQNLVESSSYLFEGGAGGGGKGPKQTRTTGGKTILHNPDASDIGSNLEGIASGDIQVR